MNKDLFLKQLNAIIYGLEQLIMRIEGYPSGESVTIDEVTELFSKSKSAIARILGEKSEYYRDVSAVISDKTIKGAYRLRKILGIVNALKSDIENDYLIKVYEIIQSEVFSDYLEMAEYLIAEGYKDAAAVIAGSTLEAHLKELAKSNSIDLHVTKASGDNAPKKANTLNDELFKASVYTSLYHKQIAAWLGIRNDAAHGDYSKYSKEQVDLMIRGIRQFTLK